MNKEKSTSVKEAAELAIKGDYNEAREILRNSGAYRSDPLAAACFALCMTALDQEYNEGERICRIALKHGRKNPLIYLFLGKVYEMRGDRAMAFQVYKSGLRRNTKSPELTEVLKIFGTRREPLVPSLGRGHVINRTCGKAKKLLNFKVDKVVPKSIKKELDNGTERYIGWVSNNS